MLNAYFLPGRDGEVADATLSRTLFLTLKPAALTRCRRLGLAGRGLSTESALVVVGVTGVAMVGGGVATRGVAGRKAGGVVDGATGHIARISSSSGARPFMWQNESMRPSTTSSISPEEFTINSLRRRFLGTMSGGAGGAT